MANLGYAGTVTTTGLMLIVDKKSYSLPADAANFGAVRDAMRGKRPLSEIMVLLEPESPIRDVVVQYGFEVKHDQFTGETGVFYDGKALKGDLSARISEYHKQGLDYTSLRNFAIKALSDKNLKRVDALFRFIDYNKLPIHPDGDVLAFKATRGTGYDRYSGKILYKVGEYVEVLDFDESQSHTCSQGLHIGGRNYVTRFGQDGDKFFIVKVNPVDFVAYSETEQGKTRVRKLFVYAETVGVDIQNALQVLVASIPEGDAAQAEADGAPVGQNEGVGLAETAQVLSEQLGPVTPKPEPSVRVRKRVSGKAAVKPAAPVSGIVGESFTRNGKTFTAKEIVDGIAERGQRGFSAYTGVPRTTVQEWLTRIEGKERRKR